MATELFTIEKKEKPEILVTKNEKQEERRINVPDEANAREEKSSEIPSLWKRLKRATAKTSKLNGAFSLIQNNSITLRNLVVAASTYGLERLLNAKAFHCPEKSYRQYGFAFLFAPAIILFCVNVLVIGEVWKLSSRMFVKRYRRRGDCFARVLPSLLKACVGPTVWLIVAFLEEDFYVCANLGPLATSRKNGTNEKQIVEYKSQSHVLAWIVLVCLVTLGTVMIVWSNCFLKDNIRMENLYSYERREALGAMKAFTELMGSTCKDANLDNDPKTAEYGSKEEKVTLYHDGIPENIGKKTVQKLFEGYKAEEWKGIDDWHYIKAYKAFKKLYPRISTGSPFDPWRVVKGDFYDKRRHKNCRDKCLSSCFKMETYRDELEPLSLNKVAPQIRRSSSEDGNTRESNV